MPAKVIVTSALPYANGPIHFGHVVGAYLPADIYVRFRRLRGDDVHFVSGTDEHGVAITLKAEQEKVPYEAYVDRWQKEIARVLRGVGIEFDIFSGTAHHRNPHHRPLAQQFFSDLLANGYLATRTEDQFFNESLGRFLPDRYVQGECYVCGFANARGDECPKCGTWLDAKRLRNPTCTLDGSTPVLRASTHWYLDLPKIRDEWLQGWFEGKGDVWKVNVRNFVERALADMPARAITRDLPWGVPVPLPDAQGKVLYVWFDAPIGYLSISKQYFSDKGDPAAFEQWWQDPATELYHFIGKDNITFHVLTFPSMLWGTKRGWIVPSNVPANEFFNLEGRKFNTSAGWYVDPDAIKDVPVDGVRYALTTMMPETADSDFTWRDFQARVNDELADNLGNLVARTARFVQRFFADALPARAPARTEDEALLASATKAAGDMADLYGSFQFRRAAARLMQLSAEGNKFYDEMQPWVTRTSAPESCTRTLRTCLELIRSLAILGQPILPATSQTLLQALGVAAPRWQDAGGERLAEGPIKLPPLPVLFPKVPDEMIAAQSAALDQLRARLDVGGKAATSAPAAADNGIEPLAAGIEFDTFAATDLRVATVVQAERHKKADKLLVLQCDLGFETRTVVAGVAESYRPEELVDRKVILVANLAPRTLRGVESRGMLLAAHDADGKPRFIAPDPTSPNGTRVR
ncbi:MAG: methionine--tRNA ligase [Planctomycetota bacterium]